MTSPQEIEDQITNLIGIRRANFHHSNVALTKSVRSLLCDWLLAMGAANETKVREASDLVLCNAYRAGKPYIDKMNQDSGSFEAKSPPGLRREFKTGRRGASGFNLHDDIKDLLGAGTGTGNYIPQKEKEDQPNQLLELVRAVIDALGPRLATAAEAVLKPQIDEATRTLRQNLGAEAQVAASRATEAALKRFIESEPLRKVVKNIATRVAEQVALDLIPRKLEIKINNETRILDAEPRHEVFNEILEWLISGEHVYMVGNAGTGKTHLFKQLGKALQRPVTIFSQVLTKYELSGYKGPTGEMVNTLLREAVENGHLCCFDEADMNSAAAMGFLNSLTANKYVAFPDTMVEAHKDFVVILAANTYGRGATQKFIGRNPLDAATLDRFAYVEVGYDPILEKQIYGNSPWLDYVHRVRNAIEELKLNHIVSMRAIERGLRGLASGKDVETVCFSSLWRGLEPDTITKIESKAGKFRANLREVA